VISAGIRSACRIGARANQPDPYKRDSSRFPSFYLNNDEEVEAVEVDQFEGEGEGETIGTSNNETSDSDSESSDAPSSDVDILEAAVHEGGVLGVKTPDGGKSDVDRLGRRLTMQPF
jgi:hypothetical protein